MRSPSIRLTALLLLLTPIAYGATMKTPDIKLNPNPRMRYEITAVVQDAPGPFDRIEGAVQYKVTDRHCVPLTPITGAAEFPEKRVPIELRRVDDHTYKGDLYVDLLQDEDYFGKGVCHWSLIGADVSFQVNKLSFSPSLFHDQLVAGHPVIRFFSDRSYELSTTQRVDTGNERREDFKEDAKRTFSIELKAQEKTP
jgi:hypothetical protein